MANPPEPPAREGLAFRGKHWRLWVGLDGVVRCIIEGDHDKASVETVLDAFAEIGDKVPERPVRVLVYAHRALRLAPEARERLIEACRAHVNLRVALVRSSPLALIQARGIARHSGRDFSYHESEPEALAALGVASVPAQPKAPPAPPLMKSATGSGWPDMGQVDFVS